MNDNILNLESEKAVRDMLVSGLTVGPKKDTASVMAKAKRQRMRLRTVAASIAALLVLALYATSPLVLPAMARMLSAVPGIGPSFEQALKLHSLDLAYAAGLLPALDKFVERDGVTLTVHTAYRDSHAFNILFSIHGDPEFVSKLANSIGPRIGLSSGRWVLGGHYSSKVYDEENDTLYISLGSFEPLPWHVRNLSLDIAWLINDEDIEKYKYSIGWDIVETSEPLAVSFPLQRPSDDLTEVIPINQTLVSGEATVEIESLVLSPVRTIVNYTSTTQEQLMLLNESGEKLRAYAGGGGYIMHEPTDSQKLIIRLLGSYVEYKVDIPLEEGYEHVGEPSFRVESITPTSERLPWVGHEGKEFYADTKVVLSWDMQNWSYAHTQFGNVQFEDDKVTLYLISEWLPPDQPLPITFGRVEGEPQDILVTR